MANFLGFKQVTLAEYNNTSDENKKGYLWLVREKNEGGEVLSSSIYFGTRLYANTTDSELATKVDNIVTTLGESVDENGDFVGFLPIEEHEILGDSSVTDFTKALEALEAAIVANAANIAALDAKIDEAESTLDEKIDSTKAELEEKIAELATASTETEEAIEALDSRMEVAETAISELDENLEKVEERVAAAEESIANEIKPAIEAIESDITDIDAELSALTEVVAGKANADEVYTKDEVYNKEEIDGKISGVFHFKGIKASVEELPTDAEIGDVWQVGDKEYAWNGSEWVELGSPVDLSAYATKEFVNSAITTAIALTAPTNLSGSIIDNTNKDAAKIAIASAIFINVFALMSF